MTRLIYLVCKLEYQKVSLIATECILFILYPFGPEQYKKKDVWSCFFPQHCLLMTAGAEMNRRPLRTSIGDKGCRTGQSRWETAPKVKWNWRNRPMMRWWNDENTPKKPDDENKDEQQPKDENEMREATCPSWTWRSIARHKSKLTPSCFIILCAMSAVKTCNHKSSKWLYRYCMFT